MLIKILSKLDRFIPRISVVLVVLAIIALPLAAFIYEYMVIPGRHPVDRKVFNITAIGNDHGIWTLQKVSGLNYWRKDPVERLEKLSFEKGDKVTLRINSADVYHSFALRIPGQRINKTIKPGQITTIEFTAEEVGTYKFSCAHICGDAHTKMMAALIVVDNKIPRTERQAIEKEI